MVRKVQGETNMKRADLLISDDELKAGVYPSDYFSYPKQLIIDHFSHAASVGVEGDLATLDDQFYENDFCLQQGTKPYTRWRFRAKQAGFATLNLSYFFYRRPLALWYEVESSAIIPFTAKLLISTMGWQRKTDLTSARYEITTVGRGGRETLYFDLTQLPEDLVLPICDVGLSIWTEAGTPFDISILGLTAEFDTLPLNGMDFTVPSALAVGEVGEISIDDAPMVKKALDLEFRKGKYVYHRARFSPEQLAESTVLPLCLPEWLAADTYTVTAAIDGIRVEGWETTVTVSGSHAEGFPKVERAIRHGRPTVLVDGEPFAWSGYASYDYVPGPVQDFSASGINLFCIPVACGQHVHAHVSDPTILGFGRYDYGQIDERVGFSLAANPNGKLLLRVNLLLPRQWIEAHPGCEPIVLYDGKAFKWAETSGVRDISLMCSEWLAEQAEELKKLVSYCESRPWGNRVIGIMLSGEVTEEWFAWGANSEGRYLGDYSTHGVQAFRQWLQHRYPEMSQALSPYTVPLPEQRRFEGARYKPNTEIGRLAAAYSEFLNQYTASVICHFAGAVKEASDRRLLCGSLYGYVIQLAGDGRQSTAGHMGLGTYLACEDIDYLAGIPWLNYRDTVNGYDAFVSAAESIAAHGKLVVNENDSFSVFHPFIWHRPYPGGNEEDPTAGASLMHRSTYAYDFIHNHPRQYFSLMATWHYDEAMQSVIGQLAELHQTYYGSELNREGVEEIAFMIDDDSYAWAEETSPYTRSLVSESLRAIGRTGAPVGTWILSDLDRLPERIRLVIITNAVAPSAETIRKIRRLMEAGGRTVLVMGELAAVRPSDLDAETEAWLDDFGMIIDWDPYCQPKSFMVRKPIGRGGLFLHSTAPITSVDIMRQLVEEAEVHCYTASENYGYASEDAVSVTAGRSGELMVAFRRPVKAYDLYSGESGIGMHQIWHFDEGQTRLFVLGNEGE